MSVAIRVENLSKYYRLGTINHGMLYKDIQSWMALKLGKQDPHAQIGADHFADRPEGFWALKDLNFDIQQGDRVGIIGKNGAGKSTLLKILSRITAPTEGVIKIKGRVTSLLEVGTGFHGELTGRENIYLNGAILGMKRSEITKKIDEIIAFSEIEQHIDTPVKRYSSGMYVRLAFAVAAHLESEILIADEVLAVGDANFQKKALSKMNEMSTGQGKTVLFVSHNLGAVRSLCSTGILLDKGRMNNIENINDIITRYLYSNQNSNIEEINQWRGGDSYDDGRIKPLFISLYNKPEERNCILNPREEIYIDFDFIIEKETSILSFEFHFFYNDIELFTVSPKSVKQEYKPKIGLNTLLLIIPPDIFSQKNYRLEIHASTIGEWILEPNRNAPMVTMQLDEFDDSNSFYKYNKNGLINPCIKIKVK